MEHASEEWPDGDDLLLAWKRCGNRRFVRASLKRNVCTMLDLLLRSTAFENFSQTASLMLPFGNTSDRLAIPFFTKWFWSLFEF